MLLIWGILISISIVIQSYIVSYKENLENTKNNHFLANAVVLIINVVLFIMTSSSDKYLKYINFSMPIILVLDLFTIIECIYQRKKSVSKVLIKQTIDKSPSGIMSLKGKNKVLFRNSIMYNLMKELKIHNNYSENVRKLAVERIGNDNVLIVNNVAWLFCISEDDEEITAFNIDEEYRLQQKLERQNVKIRNNNLEIMWTIDNMEELEKEEKTIKIKNRFHDLLGQNLSILQAYLNQKIKDEKKFNEVKFMIKKMFTHFEDTDNPKINLNNLIEVNKHVGIKINLKGKLPEDKDKAKIFFEIIREAVTNAIRHANSTQINVVIKNDNNKSTMTIMNNGSRPKGVIVEHEGIKGMKRRAKRINGNIYINTQPEFQIYICA